MKVWSSRSPTQQIVAFFAPKFSSYCRARSDCRSTAASTSFEPEVAQSAQSRCHFEAKSSKQRKIYHTSASRSDLTLASLRSWSPICRPSRRERPTVAISQADKGTMDALNRLVQLLSEPAAIPILAPTFERELYYRLLQGPTSHTLRNVVLNGARLKRIQSAIAWMHANPFASLRVSLSSTAGMSATSFHRLFKNATSYSPLAYQRNIRLIQARSMLVAGTHNVTAAAFATGYATSSQFSREYKHMFGVAPVRHALDAH